MILPTSSPSVASLTADIDFDKHFPKLSSAMENYDSIMQMDYFRKQKFECNKDYDKFSKVQMEELHSKFDEELSNTLPNHLWNTLNSMNDHFVAMHSINVLYSTVTDKRYLVYNKYE